MMRWHLILVHELKATTAKPVSLRLLIPLLTSPKCAPSKVVFTRVAAAVPSEFIRSEISWTETSWVDQDLPPFLELSELWHPELQMQGRAPNLSILAVLRDWIGWLSFSFLAGSQLRCSGSGVEPARRPAQNKLP